ncbi:hypothetical protein [Polaribacter aquimarinus]|uniref:Restriction endonuclease type IV Mrr domain-containing protein n=1 Tax=Polaribacter aquimarinus TaxID=2100726 RepID=A0A2U2J7T2_9FLAO|nr:hypothetical protein [Polaribacter aquimarinus]PWG04398.1 hypothetical protein DIS07_13415 [Polaribacter aquimarinus]
MNYREKYDEISKLDSRPRGFAFEKLINEMFDDCKILINKSYKTKDQSQQIDGAIEIGSRIFLLEAKWENSGTLAASKLYSFLGKINSKLEGTLGIFISHNRLKDNFVNAIRDGLRQNCILIHGEENINEIVDGNLRLDKYILHCYREASTKNIVEISASEYISLRGKIETDQDNNISKSNWSEIYKEIINESDESAFVNFMQQNEVLNNDIPKNLVNVLPHISLEFNTKQKLKFLIEKIEEENLNTYKNSIKNKLTGDYWRKFSQDEIISILVSKLDLNQSDYKEIILNVTSNFNGDWELENDASRILGALFDKLDDDNKKLIAKKFLTIYLDDFRKSKFQQKQFANKVFREIKNNNNLYELFSDHIIKELKNEKKVEEIWIKEGLITPEELKKRLINRILSKYSNFYIDSEREKIKEDLQNKYDSL